MKKLTRSICQGAIVLAVMPAYADINSEIQILKEKIKELEEKSVKTAPKGGLQIGNTTLNIGGYIKADILYTDNGVNGTNALISAASVQTADEDEDNRIDLSARESRFFIKTSTPFGGKPLKTHLEADFFGSGGNEFVSNSNGLRVRHAYGSWGKWLFGQTWSTFMDLSHLAELNAFGQHASTIFVRQTQLRYTHPFDGGSFMFSIENPEDGGDDQKTPDVVARVNFDGNFGHVSAGILAREITDGEDTDAAVAFSITGRFPTFGKDDIRVQYNDGALGRYMGLRTYPSERTTSSGVEAFESWGASVAYRHWWTSKLRSTFMYSVTEADETVTGSDREETESIHVNLMWSANPKLRYGIEYASWEVDSGDGTTDEVDAVQFSARYLF